jgi:DNA-binding HxlR family transcriptional regulator
MRDDGRSGCAINLTLEALGDTWSLLVIRDIMFAGRRHFRDLLTNSMEGISSNILADRLRALLERGLLTRTDDPSHRQKAIYSLTEPAIQLVPLLVAMGAWGRRHTAATEELSIRAELLEKGGPPMWEAFMDDLREAHLGPKARKRPKPPGPPVVDRLQAAYDRVVARNATTRAA